LAAKLNTGIRPITNYNGSSGTYLPVGGIIMATVAFREATRTYPGNDKPSVDRLNIEIADGEFLVLVGPSGCGKSTSLRMLAGLEPVDSGQIFIGDRDVTNLAPKDRDIAMVFQNYALYPHMSVADNMGFALKIAGTPKEEIRQRVEDAAKLLDLSEYLDRKPKALSGGQRQRVAMGRAIVREPQVFLMDEPLSNLDAKLRVQTRTQIASLQRRLGVTTVYVTHDQTEAMTMGDRVVVLKDGELQQIDTPQNLYDHPNNIFVAGFIGSPAMNLVSGSIADNGVIVGGATLSIPADVLADAKSKNLKEVRVGFRPEDLVVGEGMAVEVEFVEVLGVDAYVHGYVETIQGTQKVVVRTDGRRPPKVGDTIRVAVNDNHIHVFDPESTLRLGK
jgi:multiple sugar transport system ATP-binding protein